MKCRTEGCDKRIVNGGHSEWMTLVGYFSPAGHNHDDNCRTREYSCEDGHRVTLSIRNTCSACDWKGKESCFCHPDGKVDSWPVA